MEEKNLLKEQYGINVTAYYNDLASSLNELTKKTLGSISNELKRLEIFDEAVISKGVEYLDKRISYSLNKNLDVLETYAKENFFDIEDLRGQIETNKENISKGKENNSNEAKSALEKEFQEYRKRRNLQMLDKLVGESKERFTQSIDGLESQYKVSEFEKQSTKNEVRIKNLENFVIKLKENNDKLDNLLKS